MERTLLTALAATLLMSASAQLAPGQEAPLFQHLAEVNAQWRTMDPSPEGGDRAIHFTTDAERIAMHLHLVRAELQARAPEGLSAAQRNARTELLNDLEAYADRGQFPQNEVLPYRNPVFIDAHHTACAVGQLMIESGNADLAQRINSEMNLAYVHDMHRGDVDAWAAAHGFTEDELAWIQPSYAPPTVWDPLGGGTDTTVTAILHLANNNLIVCGPFALAGGIGCTRVARWNGSSYQPLGGGVNGSPICATEFNGSIYLGGQFQNYSMDLAVWNGSNWSYQNVFAGMGPIVNALHVHNGVLHAAGSSSGFAGTFDGVASWNGNTWTPVGSFLNAPILALESHDGALVAGGYFTGLHSFGAPDSSIQHVAVMNTDWEQLGNGLNGAVRDLLTENDSLYACGDLFENIAVVFGMARLGAGGSSWEQLMPDHNTYINSTLGPSYIASMVANNGKLYLGGRFEYESFMVYGSNVLQFDGAPDAFTSLGGINAPVNATAIWNSQLVIGGEFSYANGTAAPFIAYTDLTTGIPDGAASDLTVHAWPNPAHDLLTLELGSSFSVNLEADVIDASGRTALASRKISGVPTVIDVSGLVPGPYVVRLHDATGSRTIPFVKD